MILHIVSRSPHSQDALQRCLAVAGIEDAIILIEDGVYALTAYERFLPAPLPVKTLYALEPDLLARGITPALSNPVQTVDYNGFVDLTAAFSKTLSWF